MNGVEIERVGLVCETKWLKFLGMCLAMTICLGLVNMPMSTRRLQLELSC